MNAFDAKKSDFHIVNKSAIHFKSIGAIDLTPELSIFNFNFVLHVENDRVCR